MTCEADDVEAACVADDGGKQAARSIDRDRDMFMPEVVHLFALEVEGGVENRMLLEGVGGGLNEERHE